MNKSHRQAHSDEAASTAEAAYATDQFLEDLARYVAALICALERLFKFARAAWYDSAPRRSKMQQAYEQAIIRFKHLVRAADANMVRVFREAFGSAATRSSDLDNVQSFVERVFKHMAK